MGGGEPSRDAARREESAGLDTTSGTAATERDVTWPAQVRVEIRRGLSQG
jgi:hypothetical protein